jgi:hypothetical protein
VKESRDERRVQSAKPKFLANTPADRPILEQGSNSLAFDHAPWISPIIALPASLKIVLFMGKCHGHQPRSAFP